MNKQLISLVMLIALVGADGCNAMDHESRTIKLFVDDPAVEFLIRVPGFDFDHKITGEVFKGATFIIPYTDRIGFKFPGEDESHYFNTDNLGLTGPIEITVIKEAPNTYKVQFEDPRTHVKAFYFHGDSVQ